MSRRWILVATLGTIALVEPRVRAEDPPSAWRDAATIERRFAEACDVVEELCGAKFTARPTVRISTPEELRPILLRELETLAKIAGEEGEVDTGVEIATRGAIAKYEPGAHRVHVLPDNAERIASELDAQAPAETDLRVVLAHEATHALDFERFPLQERARQAPTLDELQAVGAMVEGHAQFVAHRAAERWGLSDAFDRYTHSITALPADLPEEHRALAETLVATLGFGYVQGHAFFEAVSKARGREGVEAALQDPPRRTALVEHPERWLEPASDEPDLDAITQALRTLVGDPDWKVTTAPLLESMLRPMGRTLPEDLRKDFLRGYQEGRLISALIPEAEASVLAIAASFEDPEDAKRFVEIEKATSDQKDEDGRIESSGSKPGAGPEGRLTGYSVHKDVRVGPRRIGVDAQAFSVGRVAVEFILTNCPWLDRAAQDETIAYVEAFVLDPEKAREATPPKARTSGIQRRVVVLEVLDPDGKPVPRAMWGAAFPNRTDDGRVRAGRAEIALTEASAEVAVWGAASEDGTPLPLAPSPARVVAADAGRVEVRFEPGVTIEGTVVDPEGKPVAEATVSATVASAAESRFPPRSTHGEATSGADGSFRIVGLAQIQYRLVVSGAIGKPSGGDPLVHGGDSSVQIVLSAVVRARIRVVDPAGAPVVGAELRVMRMTERDPFFDVARTNAQGEARIDGLDPEAAYQVTVEAPASREDLADLDVDHWAPTAEPLAMSTGWTLRGRVVSPDGAPMRAAVQRKGQPMREVRTDRDGRFVLPGNRLGPVEVVARHPQAGSGWDPDARWVRVEPGTEATLPLDPGTAPRRITLRILDPDGRRVPRARVRLQSPDRSHTKFQQVIGGEETVEVPPGRLHVEVYAAASHSGERLDLAAVSRENVEEDVLEIRLPKGRTLRGRVQDDQGHGVADVQIDAFPAEEDRLSRLPKDESRMSWTRTGPDGVFELRGLDERRHVLRVQPRPPLAGVEVSEPPAGTEEPLTISVGAAAVITVLDAAGEPIHDARVTVTVRTVTPGGWGEHLEDLGTTDRKGQVFAREVGPARELTLRVMPPPGREDLAQHVAANWKPESATIALSPGFTVRGLVEDDDGPVTEALITWSQVEGTDADDPWDVRWTDRTDGAGKFVLRHLPRTTVTLRATLYANGRNRETPRVEADPEHPDVVLRMPSSPKEVRIRVTGASQGQRGMLKPAGAGLSVGPRAFFFEADGSAVVKDVVRGTYSIWVPNVGTDGLVAWAPSVELAGGEVTIEPSASVEMRFRLKMPPDADVDSVDVLGPLEFAAHAEQVGDVWVARGLPPGRWKIHARARTPNAWVYADEPADTGTEIEIELRPR